MTALSAPRAVAMRSRVLRRYAWMGAPPAALELLDTCVTAALAARERRLPDEEDPRFLHPARTVLILIDDAEVASPAVLAAAALVESVDPALATDAGVFGALPAAATSLAARVPLPRTAGDDLAEALVSASADVLRIAVAERLDQARHAHMLAGFDAGAWLAETRALYQPLAGRVHARLATRYDRWASALERRHARG